MPNTTTADKHNYQRAPFTVVERQVPCQHKIQFYVDYGASDGGPWLRIGVNTTEFGFGHLPLHQPVDLHVAKPGV